MSDLTQFDHYLDRNSPAALLIREHLVPVEGPEGVIFPASFAPEQKDSPSQYNIDGPDGKNVCLIDSVGSQANRIEPLFKEDPYTSLVPQIIIQAGEKSINLIDAGHRAGDAIIRCSELQAELQNAFKAFLKGDAVPLAKIAPTSLVFGVWDSRDTQAKLPRLIASTIRAYDVRRLTRSAQYKATIRYVEAGLLDEPKDTASKKAYSKRGYQDAPAVGTPGGVIADGGIRREAILALTPLRLLGAKGDKAQRLALHRYIMGLALTAFTHRTADYLRQGCLLILDVQHPEPRAFSEVYSDGKRQACAITHESALAYTMKAAASFGVGPNRAIMFDKVKAKKDAQKKENSSEE